METRPPSDQGRGSEPRQAREETRPPSIEQDQAHEETRPPTSDQGRGSEPRQAHEELRAPSPEKPQTPGPSPGRLPVEAASAPTNPPLADNPASERADAPPGTAANPVQLAEASESRGQECARLSTVERPSNPPAEAGRPEQRMAVGSGSDDDAPTLVQWAMIREESDQMLSDVQENTELAETARDEAAAARKSAEQTRREQKVLVDRIRYLETLLCGRPQQARSERELEALEPNRKQQRKS